MITGANEVETGGIWESDVQMEQEMKGGGAEGEAVLASASPPSCRSLIVVLSGRRDVNETFTARTHHWVAAACPQLILFLSSTSHLSIRNIGAARLMPPITFLHISPGGGLTAPFIKYDPRGHRWPTDFHFDASKSNIDDAAPHLATVQPGRFS